MSRPTNLLDHQPGAVPDITTDRRGVTFVMRPLGVTNDQRLVIRCDDAGDVWLSVRPAVAKAV